MVRGAGVRRAGMRAACWTAGCFDAGGRQRYRNSPVKQCNKSEVVVVVVWWVSPGLSEDVGSLLAPRGPARLVASSCKAAIA